MMGEMISCFMEWHSVRKDAELWLQECKFIRQATLNIKLEDFNKNQGCRFETNRNNFRRVS